MVARHPVQWTAAIVFLHFTLPEGLAAAAASAGVEQSPPATIHPNCGCARMASCPSARPRVAAGSPWQESSRLLEKVDRSGHDVIHSPNQLKLPSRHARTRLRLEDLPHGPPDVGLDGGGELSVRRCICFNPQAVQVGCCRRAPGCATDASHRANDKLRQHGQPRSRNARGRQREASEDVRPHTADCPRFLRTGHFPQRE